MFKWMLSLLLLTNLYALDISLQGAKENFESYSTLHIKDRSKFVCQEIKDDFDVVQKVVCAFAKSPSTEIKPIQNDFFKITTKIKNKTFFLIITPFKKLKLYPVLFNLTVDATVYSVDAKLSHHWMIIGYDKELPYIKSNDSSDIAINFPFYLEDDSYPYVGSLDIKGNPVYIQKVRDVSDYLKIKRYYKEKKYEKCLEVVDDVMKEYPSSLFHAEMLYYKIRANAKLARNDDVIELSKIYLREYSADEDVAEVLALAARAYAINGLTSQADYFFDRLFDEHKKSPYAKWGYIYRGEMLEESGGVSKALEYYTKALQETSDLDIAATAAFKLAKYKINNGPKKEASKYIMKIVKAKPSFFMTKYKESIEMIPLFANSQKYIAAAAIAQAIVDQTDKEYDEYESLLSNIGIWLSKTSKKEDALAALNRYLKEFPDGQFESEVQTSKDGLFFDVKSNQELNVTEKLDDYDELIDTYSNDSIGNRAIYEKANLMLEHKMYVDVLEFKDAILSLDSVAYPDASAIIDAAALGEMQIALQKRECGSVLSISSEYSIELSDKWDDGIYECAMKGANFTLAKKTINKHLKSKDLEIRKKWLYRYIKAEFATGNYSDIIQASQELILLIEDDKNSKYKDVYRVLFDTYQRLENDDKMISAMIKLQEVFGSSYKDIERYMALLTIGSQRSDDNIVIKYAKEVMKIQKSSSSYAQSPFVEFTLYQAYINREDFNEALKVLKSLDKVELSKSNRARQKYLLGSIYEKLWRDEDAQKAYKEAIDADKESAWAKLAEGAKEN